MDGYLRQSTAGQVRTIGPFVDDTDFKVLEDGLTIANTDIWLKKNGASGAAKNSGGATADGSLGLYHLTWDATDTATVGELKYACRPSGALVVFGTYVVVEEAVYDAFFAASAPGYVANAPVNVAQISGDTTAADNLESYTDGTEFMPVDAHKPVFAISGGTLTVKKPDGTTTAHTKTLATDAAAEPIISAS